MPTTSKAPNFSQHPVFWLAVCFAIGIALAKFVPLSGAFPFGTASAGFAVLTLLLNKHRVAALFLAVSFALAGSFGFLCEVERNKEHDLKMLYDSGEIASGSPVEIEGVIAAGIEPSVDGDLITVRVEKFRYRGEDRKVSGKVRLFVQHSKTEFEISDQRSAMAEKGSEISNLRNESSDLKYGSRIRVSCSLEREDEFLNPGVIPRKQILDRLGVDASGSVKSRMLIEHLADESVFWPLAWVYDQRAKMIDVFRRNLSPRAAGVMIASLLGDKYFLDKETADLFRDGGTFHILVISGLHITFIGGVLLLIIRRFTRNRWFQFTTTNGFLWAYTLAVGADVPVVRAAVMFTVISFSSVIYRRSDLFNSLGVCALILLVWRPSELFDPSFQLTFVSVAAIIGSAFPLITILRKIGTWTPSATAPFPADVPKWLSRFCETIYWNGEAWQIESKRNIWSAGLSKSPFLPVTISGGIKRFSRFIFEGILVSLIVQIWMLPLSVVYFHRVSIASILLNLWVGVFITIESFSAVIGIFIGFFADALARPFFELAEISDWLMLALPRLFSDNGWASFRLPAYSGYGKAVYFLFFIPVILFAFSLRRWKPFDLKGRSLLISPRVLISAFVSLAVLTSVIVFHPFSTPKPDGRLHIDFLDVGQGDAALITFPDGSTMLVDGGGRIDYQTADEGEEPFVRDVRGIGETVVSEFLWFRGYSRIDHILATHAHADHIQGLTEVTKNFSIGSALFGRMPKDDRDFSELEDEIRRRGVRSEMISRGDVMEFGDVKIKVFYPEPFDEAYAASDNDNSVVLLIVYGNRKFLLTGDIELRAESSLLNRDLSADLIKVPHHGSRTSSTQAFVNAVRAKYAVISVGRNSLFGHPHPEVVERWKASGTEVLTTGSNGLISFSTDGNDLVLRRFVEEK